MLYQKTGCLQLLEISWNLIGPRGKFCVRCRRSTALVSSHKYMDKYSLQKYQIYRHQMCFFKFPMHQNPFLAGARPWTLVAELMTLGSIWKYNVGLLFSEWECTSYHYHSVLVTSRTKLLVTEDTIPFSDWQYLVPIRRYLPIITIMYNVTT